MKVLLVEDDQLLSALYQRQFVAANIPIDVVGDGKSGMVAMAKNTYDVVLLDILLPDIDGIEIFKQMKAQDSMKHIPVIFLTNLSQDEKIAQAFSLGAKGYLVKASYSPDQIVSEVRNFLTQPTVSS